jgi:hypothetical protein
MTSKWGRLHLVSGSMYRIPPNLPIYPQNPHGYTLKCFSFLSSCAQCQKATCGSCGFCTTSLFMYVNWNGSNTPRRTSKSSENFSVHTDSFK